MKDAFVQMDTERLAGCDRIPGDDHTCDNRALCTGRSSELTRCRRDVVRCGISRCLIGLVMMTGCSTNDQTAKTPSPGTSASAKSRVPNSDQRAVANPAPQHADGSTMIRLLDCEEFYSRGPDTKPTWTDRDGMIQCSGQPKGYLYTRAVYRNFILRCEFRYPVPAGANDAAALDLCNTGFLLYITGKHKQWPDCLEVQGRMDTIATIKANGGSPMPEVDDNDAVRQESRRPVGEWNEIEIESRDGAVTAVLNGSLVCSSRSGPLNEGLIGIQSENYAVEFRNLRVLQQP